jgi:hypothetical protein
MDGARFDRLSRLLAGQDDRRGVVRKLAAAVAGISAAGALQADEAAAAATACRKGRQTCSRNAQCCSGTCQLGTGFSLRDRNRCACEGGKTLCGPACVDTDTDRKNCGECGRRCPNGVPCIDGNCCVPNDVAGCKSDADCCNELSVCNEGVCECPAVEGICSDWDECREDFLGCEEGLRCRWYDGCYDTNTDATHCGQWFTDCSYAGTETCPTCVGGTCSNVCSSTRNALVDVECNLITGWSYVSSQVYPDGTTYCDSNADCDKCEDAEGPCACVQFSCYQTGQWRVNTSFPIGTSEQGICALNAAPRPDFGVNILRSTGEWFGENFVSVSAIDLTPVSDPNSGCDSDDDCTAYCNAAGPGVGCMCAVGYVRAAEPWHAFASPTCVRYTSF